MCKNVIVCLMLFVLAVILICQNVEARLHESRAKQECEQFCKKWSRDEVGTVLWVSKTSHQGRLRLKVLITGYMAFICEVNCEQEIPAFLEQGSKVHRELKFVPEKIGEGKWKAKIIRNSLRSAENILEGVPSLEDVIFE